MATLHDVLQTHVDNGALPGAVAIVADRNGMEEAAVGFAHAGDTVPMTPDSIFRLASLTKPITAAALLMLVDDGQVGLHDPVDRWLPELAHPKVLRTPASPIDDVVPADRPITVFDLLSSHAGYGFASDFDLPVMHALFTVQKDGREPQSFPPVDEWMAALGAIPLLSQPGTAWLYDTCSAIQGVLIARASGHSLPDFLSERIFEPLGMTDTGFTVPKSERHRFTSYYRQGEDGLKLADGPNGQWSTPPAFPLGSGGLAGTAGDWLRFGEMLLAEGVSTDGHRLLSTESIALMTTDHTTPASRKFGELFLDGQGWGFGGSVDIAPIDAWNVPGRYGWVGGTGTSAHIVPSTGSIAILLTQVGADSPVPDPWIRDFWSYPTTLEGPTAG
ncbi:serine hydrolase domain-containing protein [Nocardia sp. NPDC051030]|uniref:serine hydrolase domain-containing protein n=1 Tax=Nocardia sp. NPDC051030 TaxID=3155162 RepID=UPI0034188EA4